MRVVFVRWVVQVDHFRSGGLEDGDQVIDGVGLGGAADLFALVAELGDESILADLGGGVLLLDAFRGHLVISPGGVRAFP